MRRFQLTSRGREVKRRRALGETKVVLPSCATLDSVGTISLTLYRRGGEDEQRHPGSGVVLYFCGRRFPVGNRRSPDREKSGSLERTPGHEMRKDKHTIFSNHNLVTQGPRQTCRDTQHHLLCGDLDYVFVFIYLCPLHESDRIGLPRKNTPRCLG